MDWSDTPDQAKFRSEVRKFIETSLPERYRPDGPGGAWQRDRVSEDADARDAARSWASSLGEQGWIAPAWPKEYGGAGLGPMNQFIFNQEMARAQAPAVGGQAVRQIGPAIIVHGTDEQKAEHLPKILSGEVAWAQGYSEPGAGSDLASLQTRAVRDGDDYVINGQKIWTSGAQWADWLVALVRTDPEAPKHRGISFMLLDRHTPGVTIRPIIDMAWDHHFNETFFEDARVPVANRVGEENRGWYVGMTLLDYERSRIEVIVETRRRIDELVEFLTSDESDQFSRVDEYDSIRHEIADRHIEGEIASNFAFRIISMQARGLVPNYESSTAKMFVAELNQRLARTGTKAFGLYSNIWDSDSEYAPLKASSTYHYIRSIPATIAGGSNEIQRNVIATRGLGLPRG